MNIGAILIYILMTVLFCMLFFYIGRYYETKEIDRIMLDILQGFKIETNIFNMRNEYVRGYNECLKDLSCIFSDEKEVKDE